MEGKGQVTEGCHGLLAARTLHLGEMIARIVQNINS